VSPCLCCQQLCNLLLNIGDEVSVGWELLAVHFLGISPDKPDDQYHVKGYIAGEVSSARGASKATVLFPELRCNLEIEAVDIMTLAAQLSAAGGESTRIQITREDLPGWSWNGNDDDAESCCESDVTADNLTDDDLESDDILDYTPMQMSLCGSPGQPICKQFEFNVAVPELSAAGPSASDGLNAFCAMKTMDMISYYLDDVLRHVRLCTNMRLKAVGCRVLTSAELFGWIAIRLLMKINKLPNVAEYWRQRDQAVGVAAFLPNCTEILSYERFVEIGKHLQLTTSESNDGQPSPGSDNCKATSVADLFKNICLNALPHPGQHICTTELMAACPTRRCPILYYSEEGCPGFKLQLLLDSATGICLSFNLMDKSGISSMQAMKELVAQSSEESGHIICSCDPKYSSHSFARDLHSLGYGFVGICQDSIVSNVVYLEPISARGSCKSASNEDHSLFEHGVALGTLLHEYCIDTAYGNGKRVKMSVAQNGHKKPFNLAVPEALSVCRMSIRVAEKFCESAGYWFTDIDGLNQKWTTRFLEVLMSIAFANIYVIQCQLGVTASSEFEFLMELYSSIRTSATAFRPTDKADDSASNNPKKLKIIPSVHDEGDHKLGTFTEKYLCNDGKTRTRRFICEFCQRTKTDKEKTRTSTTYCKQCLVPLHECCFEEFHHQFLPQQGPDFVLVPCEQCLNAEKSGASTTPNK
jgi:hypothetical protein